MVRKSLSSLDMTSTPGVAVETAAACDSSTTSATSVDIDVGVTDGSCVENDGRTIVVNELLTYARCYRDKANAASWHKVVVPYVKC